MLPAASELHREREPFFARPEGLRLSELTGWTLLSSSVIIKEQQRGENDMSGSSGGGSWPTDVSYIPCDQLKFITQISSPQHPAILSVNPGDVLEVAIQPLNGIQAVTVLKNGQVVGGLVGGKVDRLRECLLQGNAFKATVLASNGPQVRVQVEPV